MTDKQSIREKIRSERASLSDDERKQKSHAICQHIITLPEFNQMSALGFYWPYGKEVDTREAIKTALELGKHCYLPRLQKDAKHMLFAEYNEHCEMTPNHYGIPEPAYESGFHANRVNLPCLFVPLVGFDNEGHRLGQGGGHYDATFADESAASFGRPMLIGLAYDLQEVEKIPADEWDVLLDGVITETGFKRFNTNQPRN